MERFLISPAPDRPSRAWMWLQLVVVWLPLVALFTAINGIVHAEPAGSALLSALRLVIPGALLGIAVYRFAARHPWPHPFRIAFVGRHLVAAVAFAAAWFAIVSLIDSLMSGRLTFVGPGIGRFGVIGTWIYIVVASAAYSNLAAQRSAMLEAHAARMQLDALRTQLHPHFLFNALHAVVQLIPSDPRAAVGAAERLAGVLRTTIEERRDLIPLAEEWAFVDGYLAIERVRFGDRLQVHVAMEEDALDLLLPSFALQTLVENAVRHGVTPRVDATALHIAAKATGRELVLSVRDLGGGADLRAVEAAAGTGLRRLRERMRWLYGDEARLELASEPGREFVATLVVPRRDDVAIASPRGDGDGW
jgi:hypothetical protein